LDGRVERMTQGTQHTDHAQQVVDVEVADQRSLQRSNLACF
jgi:hypothetical protein